MRSNVMARPRARDDLAVVGVDDELVVYDATSGLLHHLDPTTALVFQLCDGSATVRETVEELAAALGVDATSVRGTVLGLVRRLRDTGLLTVEPAAAIRPAGEDKRRQVRREVPTND